MITTDTGTGTTTMPGRTTSPDTTPVPVANPLSSGDRLSSGDTPGAYVPHAPTRRRLTEAGLPPDSAPLTFASPRGGGPRTVADSGGGSGRLPADPRDPLAIGALRDPAGTGAQSVLLDGATGVVSTARLLPDHPGPTDRHPLAPSLRTLTDLMAATDERAAGRGRFASFESRFGQQAVTGTSRHLLALLGEAADGEVPPFRRATALIRPPALVAAPPAGAPVGAALTLDLPGRLLDEEFGPGKVMRFEDVDFPAVLAHEPTRRFLRETGLPEDGPLFHLDTDVPLPTLAEYYEDERPYVCPPDRLPPHSDRLIRLGHLAEDNSLVVDGATGALLEWHEPDAALYALNADVSTLAFTLWLLHRGRTIAESLPDGPTGGARGHLSTAVIRTPTAVDPTGPASEGDRHYRTRMLRDEAARVL